MRISAWTVSTAVGSSRYSSLSDPVGVANHKGDSVGASSEIGACDSLGVNTLEEGKSCLYSGCSGSIVNQYPVPSSLGSIHLSLVVQ